ncbi:MAG: matrixin family metalloprotease [Myxococcaceae bacterium]|nr:matrixin family metalloprotease [Myxococcaceae bacterium]
MKRLGLAAMVVLSATAFADPSGHKWFNLPVTYQLATSVDNTGATSIQGGVSYANALTAMRASFATWTKSQVSGTLWDSVEGAQFSSPSGRAAIDGNDGKNLVLFINGWTQGSQTLGVTWTSTFSSGQIVNADMELNNKDVAWFVGNAVQGRIDVQSVVTHEAGHFLGLDHTAFNVADAVMNPATAPGDIKRTLRLKDIQDVTAVYPGAAGSQGTTCTTDGNCTGTRKCRSAPSGGQLICTEVCAAAGDVCPPGYACQTANTGMACLPARLPADYCKFCTQGSDCSTGSCITDGQGHNWCSTTCTTGAGCGTGATCYAPQGSTTGVCGPNGAGKCTNQCTGANTGCATGYICNGGQCEPSGNIGDRCETSGFCKPCGICIGTQAAAYCRVCCGGTGGGGSCTSCANAACASGNACQQLQGSADKVCIPTVGADLCQACSGSTPCLNGASCIAGRCHYTCNPVAPGSCSACFDQGGGNGVCACPDEVAQLGQACGVSGSSFKACSTGLACVGNPSACRRTCTLGNPASCNAGETCTMLDNQAVCLTATAGSACTACNGTTCNAGLTCLQGRCYQPCNALSAGACSTCAQVSGDGNGVCACSDQLTKASGEACGGNPSVALCRTGLRCLGGFCRDECNVNSNPSTCPAGLECKVAFDNAGGVLGVYCQSPGGAGGGGGSSGAGGGTTSSSGGGTTSGSGGGDGSSSGGGTGGGTTGGSQGCGCSAGSALGLWPVLGLALVALRRRRA